MKLFPIKKILILVTILAVPGFLYYLLQDKGKNRYKPLPYFGPKTVAATFHSVRGTKIADTNYHQIADFKLLNQQADTIAWKSFERKIIVLNLFYATDNPATKTANNALSVLRKTYGKNKIINFVSLSIDPGRDTPDVLSKYALKYNAKPGKWDLLTGDSTQINNLVKQELFIDVVQKNENGIKHFAYNNLFVLIDFKHHIRGYYDISTQEAFSKLDDEIKVLIVEELRNNTDGR
ncbi:protein SCO1/2 [Pedobacter sp. CG_S7]|uniref:SCO family protein n=1 Tax=Pedobacter sp. CG_S7 TaxID=3143930 RepID=UPI00339A78AD